MSEIRLIKPYIGFNEVEAEFREIFQSGMFTRGKHVEALRREIAAYTSAKHVFLATSATTALWTCLRLLGIGPGDEVIVSDFSFPASANVVEDVGARPVFADVSLDTFNMLPEDLERKLTPRTKAVIFVDALGNPSGAARIREICDYHGIPMIDDAACALGSAENNRRSGAIAHLTCFSFHPRKLICTGEGGAITTDSDEWARWLEVKLSHGAEGINGCGLDFVDYGYNFRLPELQAVMARKQLAKLDSIVDERNRTRSQYEQVLAPLGFSVQHLNAGVRHNVQSLVFRVPDGYSRDNLIRHLKEQDIESTIGTYSLSDTSYYRRRYGDVQPNAKLLNDVAITLPCYAGVDYTRVAKSIRAFRGCRDLVS